MRDGRRVYVDGDQYRDEQGRVLTGADRDEAAPRRIHRIYAVFNAKQMDGIPPYVSKQRQELEIVRAAKSILENFGARILHDQNDCASTIAPPIRSSCRPRRRSLLVLLAQHTSSLERQHWYNSQKREQRYPSGWLAGGSTTEDVAGGNTAASTPPHPNLPAAASSPLPLRRPSRTCAHRDRATSPDLLVAQFKFESEV